MGNDAHEPSKLEHLADVIARLQAYGRVLRQLEKRAEKEERIGMTEDEALFKLIGQDAQAWGAMARELKLGADVILPELQKVTRVDARLDEPNVTERQLAYIRTYMMLIGYAFENLLKGIAIGKKPSLVTEKNVNTKELLGHNLVKHAWSLPGIASDELDLLKRCEIYTYWAGRYSIPTESARYSPTKDKRSYISADPELVETLFAKLEALLEEAWATSSANE